MGQNRKLLPKEIYLDEISTPNEREISIRTRNGRNESPLRNLFENSLLNRKNVNEKLQRAQYK